MFNYNIGQRVRIKTTAFSQSNDSSDIVLRGQIGFLVGIIDDYDGVIIWLWKSESGQEAALVDSEFEKIDINKE